jgi:thiol-disulfide isomerase/thioredoxin
MRLRQMPRLQTPKESRRFVKVIMKMMQLKLTGILAALLASATFGLAAAPELKLGDPAPKLQTGKWIQGEPVKEFEPGKAYIVEFWATWCGPCRQTIPHVNEIYQKYKDKGLIVIGQDCWEQDETKVEPFVKQMGDKMTYRVALDDKKGSEKGKMADTWMEAAGQDGIPTAFVVDTKGKIAFIGHPMELETKLIDDVLAGKFDVKKAIEEKDQIQKKQAEMQPKIRELSRAMSAKDWSAAEKVVAELEKILPESQLQGLDQVKIQILMGKKDWTGAEKKLDALAKAVPEERRLAVDMMRIPILMGKGDYTAAYKQISKVSDDNKDNAPLQNELAWQILTDSTIKQRDLKLAEACAIRANDSTQGKEPAVLDTLARAYFMTGRKQQAIETIEKAIKLADSNIKSILEDTLASYKKGELPKVDSDGE